VQIHRGRDAERHHDEAHERDECDRSDQRGQHAADERRRGRRRREKTARVAQEQTGAAEETECVRPDGLFGVGRARLALRRRRIGSIAAPDQAPAVGERDDERVVGLARSRDRRARHAHVTAADAIALARADRDRVRRRRNDFA
jgi:hypothetical protein